MTPIFSRPNAAMFAYEQSLLRPRRWPPTRHDVPTLWERAKAMFAIVTGAITSASLARRARFARKERGHLLTRLVPVEKLVRMLMMIEAATFLLMTPEGRRLRAETPKITPPAPPAPVAPAKSGVAKPVFATRILMPGWQTIAAYHPQIDPRVTEREQREALERRLASATTSAPDPDNPGTWRCGFRVLRWVHDHAEESPPLKTPLPPNRPRLISFDDSNYPIVAGMTVATTTPRATAPGENTEIHKGRDIARRIEALARVLANPGPAIRRLAQRLAALPADALPEPVMAGVQTRGWHHGVPENWNACALAAPAFRALAWITAWSERKHDPG